VIERPTESEDDVERLDLDTSEEPEPDWAERIRRGRRERAERLRGVLGPPEEGPEGSRDVASERPATNASEEPGEEAP
jgi:hypothetical protein